MTETIDVDIDSNHKGAIFESYYYRTCKRWTYNTGQWPFRNRYLNIIGIIAMFFMWNGTPALFNAAWKLWKKNKMDAIVEACPPTMVVLGGFIKFSNSVLNREKIREMLNVIEEDWKKTTDEEAYKILVKYADNTRIVTVLYAYFMVWSLTTYMLIPFISDLMDIIAPLNVSRERRLPCPLDYHFKTPEEVPYFFAWTHCLGAATSSMFLIIGSDLLYITLVKHCCGIFARSRYYMEHFADEVDEVKYPDQNCIDTNLNIARVESIYRNRLIVAIELHQKAIEFSSRLDSSYAISLLFLIGMNMIVTSITCLHIIMKIGEWDEILVPFVFTAAQVLHLLFLCLLGQYIINESLLINTFSYTSEWYNIPCKIQKMLGLILVRTAVPSTLSAGHFFIFKMETFSAVMQTSMSYLTVMSNFE